jgi:hypothetical protein
MVSDIDWRAPATVVTGPRATALQGNRTKTSHGQDEAEIPHLGSGVEGRYARRARNHADFWRQLSWFHQSKGGGGHASSGSRLPLARSEELVVEEVGDELLVYDKTTNRAHCLSPIAVKVWRACDGYTSTDVLCTKLDLDSATIGQVVDELERNSLLEAPPQIGHTRRELTVKTAKLGVAASVPFIYSVLGPVPMAAATPTVSQCALYSADACDTCGTVCGCCCACSGCTITSGGTSGNGCKICYPTSLFPTIPSGSNGCGTAVSGGGVVVSGCSASGSCSPAGVPPSCQQPCSGGIILPTGNNCDGRFPNPC